MRPQVTDLDLTLLQRRAAQLLAPWRAAEGPGVSVGVVLGRDLVLHESAGLASIELGVAIGPATAFRIASVSKQFTCAAVLMLAEEGKLSLDDDIRLYLPEMPDCGHVVTVDHLMHNASGIRDMLEIMRLGGVDLGMPVSQAQLLEGIFRQRTLNFPAGSRYLYSNSGFLLLGLIAERVSGEKLRHFLARRIFAPCGMTRTRMVESTTEVVPNLATGYLPADPAQGVGPWVQARQGFAVGGEGALVSTVADLALWARACATNRLGATLTAALEHCDPFTNGLVNDYARGLREAEVRGIRTVSHGGLWPGFKTEFLRVPELDAAIIVIANNAVADPYAIGQGLLHHLLDGRAGTRPAPRLPEADVLARHAGRFLDPAGPATVDFTLTPAGTLAGSVNGVPFGVRSGEDGRLVAARAGKDFSFRLAADGQSMDIELDAGATATYRRVAPGAALPPDLAGTYRSDEMGATWTIAPGKDGLEIMVAGPLAHGGPWPLEGLSGDIFRIWIPGALYNSWLDATIRRNEAGAAMGLLVNGNRTKNLVLHKVPG